MGLNAEMVVGIKKGKLTESQIRDLAYYIAAGFGHRFFWISRGDPMGRQDAIEELEGEAVGRLIWEKDQKKYKQFLKVHVWVRYYGEGYERGYLPNIIMIARWLEEGIPNCDVWYGDDTGSSLELFDRKRQEELFLHFVKHGDAPYRRRFDGGEIAHDCDFCEKPMIRSGWGAQYAVFYCPGCGLKEETMDGGKSFEEVKR
jgi:hypothetical protein